ncbi:hypothetical protein [Planifilum fimeticola]
MRKKWLAAGAVLALGVMIFFVTVFSASASAKGYEVYKTALEKTKEAKSLTADVDVLITDNGAKLMTGRAKVKLNKEMKAGSVEATFRDESGDGSKPFSRQVYWQDGKVIFKEGDEDVYRWMEHPKGEKGREGPPGRAKAAGIVANVLMRSLQDDMTVEREPDGGKRVELTLSERQIPSFADAIGTMAISKASRSHSWGPVRECKVELPELTKEVKVEGIDLTADVAPKNSLEQQTVKIRMTGTDDSGKRHELTLQIRVRFSGIGETVPERIDLTGKKTRKMEADRMKFGWQH